MPHTSLIDEAGHTERSADTFLIPWWSFGKTVLATAALRLVQQGALALDAPLPGTRYTLRQLLRHEAGLADYGGLPAYHRAVAAGTTPWPAAQMLALIATAFPSAAPGGEWTYSNIGYFHVAGLLVSACGKSLETVLADEVFGPAGIRSARLALVPKDVRDVAMHTERPYHPGWVYHGLIVGTLADAARLLHLLLNGNILKPATLRDMMQARALPQFCGPVWEAPGYGLGLMRGSAGGTTLTGHTGEGPGSAIAVYGVERPGGWRVAAAWSPAVRAASVEGCTVRLLAPCISPPHCAT